jgi:hypothetical protein
VIGVLLTLNIISYLNLYYNHLDPESFFFRKTNFDEEKNAPSIFSACLHFIASILLTIVGFSKLKIENSKKFWWSLSFVFLFTGMDELLRIHEKIGGSISNTYETSGILHFAWVIPYVLAVFLLALFIFKPLFRLPKKTVINFIVAGFLFILGAVGVEMLTGWYIEHYQLDETKLFRIPDTFILSTIEELLEMLGMSLFVYAILLFLKKYRLS